MPGRPGTDRRSYGRTGPATGKGTAMATKRLSYLTRALVLRLRQAEPDRSLASIADTCGCSEPSVRRILQAHTTDARSLTHDLLVSGTIERLDEWARASKNAAERGFHQGAREWLEAADVIDRKGPAVQVDARPTINVSIPFVLGALAGQVASPGPAEPGPVIDTHARSTDPTRDTD
jgi:hypothetical protein